MEKRGVPATLIVTEEFVRLALVERRGLGVPAMPFTLIAHPLGDQPQAGVEARAEAAIEQIAHALTTPAWQLAEEEAQRQYPLPKVGQRSRP